MKVLRFAAALAAMTLAGFGAHAQGYPAKPVTVVVPFSAGGPTDTLARIMADDFAAHDPYAGLEWARGLEPPVAGIEATMLASIARSNPFEAIDLAAKSRILWLVQARGFV